jgi:chloride channel 3/4/5
MVGVSVGILAAAIDIVTDWLGDLKEGFCRPTFYLNRGFCCWGISGTTSPVPLGMVSNGVVEQEYCSDWHTWATALHVSSRAGGYIVSYLFFIVLAVPSLASHTE